MMNDKDLRVLSELASRMRERHTTAQVWGFGSRTRGDLIEEPDFDVCVVVDTLDEHIDGAIMGIAWEVAFKHGIIISTVTFSGQEFEEGPCSRSSLVRTLVCEGQAA